MSVLSLEDEGKYLMDEQGEQIGIVTEVDADAQVAYVEPNPGVGEAVIQGFGFGDADGDDIEVPADAVETITDSELRVATDL
jgi:sporulation protein YlmC with PRC-barrel domain